MDPNVSEIPWHHSLTFASKHDHDKLTFAYYESNGDVQTLPPVRRAINMVVQSLLDQGHEGIFFGKSII